MDVVLEIVDTYIGDYIYAWAHPAHPTSYEFLNTNSNSTELFSSSWQYKTANPYFEVTPSKYAYMSAWDRDNVYRQAISLYLITWFVVHPFLCMSFLEC